MPDRVPSYGEPWIVDRHCYGSDFHGIKDMGSDAILKGDASGWNAKIERAVACVNALAGRRPEALTELEASLEVFVEHENDAIQKNRAMQRVIAALAAFRGESHAG